MVKHHSNLKSNSFEEEFFKDTNVKSVIKSKSLNHSYGYMYKSDLILFLWFHNCIRSHKHE